MARKDGSKKRPRSNQEGEGFKQKKKRRQSMGGRHADPNNVRERRDVRLKINNAMKANEQNMGALTDGTSTQLVDALKVREQLFDKVSHSTEACKDAQLGNQLTGALYQQSLKDRSHLSPRELFKKLKQRFLDNATGEVDWAEIGRAKAFRSPTLPHIHSGYLTPTIGVEVKQRKKKIMQLRKKQLEDGCKLTQPKQFAKEAHQMENDQQKRVNEMGITMAKLLCYVSDDGKARSRSMDFYQFVVNPASVAQTMENLFDLAFLAKNEVCKVHIDSSDDNIVKVRPSRLLLGQATATQQKDLEKKGENGQAIWTYNSGLHQKVLHAYGWTKDTPSCIPDRTEQYRKLNLVAE